MTGMDSDSGQSITDKERNWQNLLDKRDDLYWQLGEKPGPPPDFPDFRALKEEVDGLEQGLLPQPFYVECPQCEDDLPDDPYGLCRPCTLANVARLEADNYDGDRHRRRLRTYDLEPEHFARLYVFQRGACAICRTALAVDETHIDHNHSSGAVRGLLCQPCNVGIGFLRDDVQSLTRAIKYLQNPPTLKVFRRGTPRSLPLGLDEALQHREKAFSGKT